MRKILLLVSATLLLYMNCNSQSKNVKLSDYDTVTYKDMLDLRLQILAAQMTCGSYSIIDMGRLGFPVSISINDKNKIVFKIEGNLKDSLSKEIQKEIISEGFLFVETGITELIDDNFPDLNFDYSKNIIGYWYLADHHIPYAKWENGIFEWINNNNYK
jgi:hypothetical protein